MVRPVVESPLRRRWLPSPSAVGPLALLLIASLVIFLRREQYPVFAPESLACIAAACIVAVPLAWLAKGWGNYSRVPVYATLMALFFDVHAGAFSGLDYWWRCFGVALLAGTLLRAHLPLLTSVVFGVILLSSILLPVRGPDAADFRRDETRPRRGELKPWVHLVLDELIGVAGIPGELDPGGIHASRLRRFFVDRGFTVFGKAYSASWFTRASLGSVVGFSMDHRSFPISRRHVGESEYFGEMVSRGYRIHVLQSDHLDFCRTEKGVPIGGVQGCSTYGSNTLHPIASLAIDSLEKSKLILGAYSRLSASVSWVRRHYETCRNRLAGHGVHLCRWRAVPLLSPLASMEVLDRLIEEIPRIRAGEMYFAHVMLPHYPYAYDSKCTLRPYPYSWLANVGDGGNDAAAWALRYRYYFEQVECVLSRLEELFARMEANDRFNDVNIIVHGDHGSRIIRTGPGKWRYNSVARHSTMFAFRQAGTEGAGVYRNDRAPINLLLPEVLGVDEARWADQVFRPMRDFESGHFVRKSGSRRKGTPP